MWLGREGGRQAKVWWLLLQFTGTLSHSPPPSCTCKCPHLICNTMSPGDQVGTSDFVRDVQNEEAAVSILKARHLANDEWNLGLNMFILRHLPTFREVCRKRDEYWRCQENWDLSCSTAPRLLPRHSWRYTEIQWEETRIGNKDSDLICIHISTHDCLFPMFHCSWTTWPLISWIVSLHCSVWQKQNTISILWLDSKWNTSMNLA